jgi:hypothetical protein
MPVTKCNLGRTRPLWLASLTILLSTASMARGQTRDPRAQADALFRQGRHAAESGDFETACAKFAESQRLDASTGTLLNLGDCEEHLGHLSASRNYYQTALRQLGGSDPRVAPAEARLAGVEARMPRLTIRASPSAPPNTVIARDGVVVPPATLGVAIPLDPGAHEVVVSAPAHLESRQSFVLEERQSRDLVASPGNDASLAQGVPERSAAPTTPAAAIAGKPARAPSESTGWRTAGWVLVGAGAVGLAVAAASGVVLLDEKSTVNAHCPSRNTCDAIGEAAARANKTWLPVNTASWIAGAVAAGAGVAVILASPTHGSAPDRPAAAISADGAGVRLGVAF